VYRQGDVLIVPMGKRKFKKARRRRPENGRVILAYGEATGHAHTMDADTVRLFEASDDEGDLITEVLMVDEPTLLTHQEHHPIRVPRGMYRIIHQREYVPRPRAHSMNWMGTVTVVD
jgi:hypothetical protein